MAISVGSVSVTVVPNAGRFWSTFKTETRPVASKVGEELAQALAAPISRKVRDSIGDGLSAGGKTAAPKGAKTGEEYGGAFGTAVRRRIEAALRALPEARIGASTTEAEQKLKDLRVELAALADKRIGIDIDETSALVQLDRMRAELDRLGAESPSVQVRTDTLAASTQLAAVQAQADALALSSPTVDVDVDSGAATAQLAAVGTAASAASLNFSPLLAAGAALAPVIVPAAAAAAAAVAGLGAASLVGVAGLGVLALGFSGVIGAVKGLSEAQSSAGKDAAASASRQTQAAAAVASAQDQVRSAVAGLANARENAADGAERAAQQVRDAEQALAQAQLDARRAQLSLTQARMEARRASEDLALQVADGALAQRQANLDVQRAKADLDRVRSDPKASQLERQQAQLTYEQAVQQTTDLGVRQRRLTTDKAAADKAGIEGSRQVIAAQQTIAQAQDKVAQAQRAASAARRAQATQERQAAFSIAQAQRSVASAQRSLGQASVATGATGSAAMDKLRDSMAGLSPAGRRFAEFLFGLKPRLLELRAVAQAGLLPGVQRGLQALEPVIPSITRLVGTLAKTLGDLFEEGSKALSGPFWTKFFDYLNDIAAPAMTTMVTILGNLGKGFAGLLLAFAPVSKGVGLGLGDMTRKFAEWGTSLNTNAGFQQFLDYVQRSIPVVVDFLRSMVAALGNLVLAAAPIGTTVLLAFTGLFDVITAIPAQALTAIAVAIGIIVAAIKAWSVAQAILNVLVAAFDALMAANPIGLVALAIGAAVATIVVAVGAFAAAFAYAWNQSEKFRTNVGETIKTLRSTLSTILNDIGLDFRALGRGFISVMEWLSGQWRDAAIGFQRTYFGLIRPALAAMNGDFGALLRIGNDTDFAMRRVADAEREVASAQKDSKSALDDLNQSRRDGVKLLDELAIKQGREATDARGANLDSRQARLDLRKLQGEMRRKGGPGDEEDRIRLERARLAVKQAEQREADLRRQRAETEQQKTAAKQQSQFGTPEAQKAVAAAAAAEVKAKADLEKIKQYSKEAGKGIGRGIVDGLGEGISAAWQLLTGRVAGLAGNLVERVKAHFGIRSPSTVFAGIGRDVVQGLITGVTERATSLVEFFRGLPGRLLAAVSGFGARLRGWAVTAMNGVTGAFSSGVTAAGKALTKIQDVARKPIGFVINRVLEGGLLKAYNAVASNFPGVPQVHIPPDVLKNFKGFATGGPVWGGIPGRDSVPALLMPGEHVWTTAEVRAAGGHGGVSAMRQAVMDQSTPRLAAGGPVGDGLGDLFASARKKATDVVKGALRLVTDPAGVLRDLVGKLIGLVPGRETAFGKAAVAVPQKIAGQLISAVTGGLFSSSTKEGSDVRGGGGLGVQRMMAILRGPFPGLALNSGFRPGSITATGNRSYHGVNRAVDVPPRMDVFDFLARSFPNSRELIFSPAGARQIWNGRPHIYSEPTRSDHFDHVHWAFDQGGYLPPGLSTVYNGTGKPEPVLTGAQFAAMRDGRSGGGTFVGELVLEDGTFMGRIRGQMEDVVDGAFGGLADAAVYGTAR